MWSGTSLDYALLAAALSFSIILFARRRPRLALPPGPKGHFLIGNMLDMPSETDAGEIYAKWGEVYGSDIVSATVFGMTIIIINTYEKAVEMLDKKGSIYSDRPRIPMAGELMGCKLSMGIMPYGRRLRSSRKMVYQELGSNHAIRAFFPHEERMRGASRDAFWKRLPTSANISRYAIILKIAYGHEAVSFNDDFIQNATRSMEEMGKGCEPSEFLVNAIPMLSYVPSWFPGAGFKKLAAEWKKHYNVMVDAPFNLVKQQMAAGRCGESFVSKWLQKGISLEEEDYLKHASGAMIGAGGETTSIALHVFFLMMSLHPDIQKQAQAELDSVIGRDRLPSFEDRAQLPYIDAIRKEILRTHPPVPQSLPHCTMQADVQDGYYIPERAMIIVNIWNITHDPKTHQRPHEFNPSRFLGPKPERNPGDVIFGFGRRICPGLRLADASLFITIATVLSLFNITPVTEGGKPILPTFEAIPGPVSRIKPFRCNIAPRDGARKANAVIALPEY
ncbi:cytochrome P450 [Desarmillaria tabescens]|uniref:Cytochrome P450 n=1 Tax=Armillaria tabescens TaxID=1929756 RepID=A0AA39K074_ARMTA|nr:cytochrome P450 [Desarmillaria tabescens]KAK0452140.1 cytochrome P450 [Desarmillaria tabescens]